MRFSHSDSLFRHGLDVLLEVFGKGTFALFLLGISDFQLSSATQHFKHQRSIAT